MVMTYSKMMPLGTKAPDFELLDTVSGKPIALSKLQPNIATVIMFICNHCPFVKHIQDELVCIAKEYQPLGICFIAISANDPATYPEDSPQKMQETAQILGYPFPYLYDETQTVAKAYQATCTPDFYVFDSHLKCVYRGRLDNSSPGNELPVTGKDLRAALNAILQHKPVSSHQKPSMGCNIKWKHGEYR